MKFLPHNYSNRELSWLEFNARVLEEAQDAGNPLLDRLKFIAIFSNNLDEFFMVRIAGLRQQLELDSQVTDVTGLTVPEQLIRIRRKTEGLLAQQYQTLQTDILPGLRQAGIFILTPDELSIAERHELERYFDKQVLPVLTPVAIDQSHPFPILANGAIEIAVALRRPRTRKTVHALVEVPSVLPRFVEIRGHFKNNTAKHAYVLLENIILEYIPKLFSQCRIVSAFPFRVLRDMDFTIDNEGAADLLARLEKQLRRSRRREPVRLEIPEGERPQTRQWLIRNLGLDELLVYEVPGPLNLADCFELVEKEQQRTDLMEPPWPALPSPYIDPDRPVIESINNHHVIPLFHPYESFDPVTRFLEEAAVDPQVLAIKQTLYRVSGDSPVVAALQRAAENGKQVTVIVEVKARFDEEQNIGWARRLEESGAHVVYGILGLKIHCKALLIIRRQDDVIRRYLHLSTGNYNDRTAEVYTDIGIFLDDLDISADIAAMFNVMTGYAEPPTWRTIDVAPFSLREKFKELIDREARLSTPHQPGHIVAKMNSLVDPEIITHLLQAAKAGVRIELVVRGICCLNPQPDTTIRIVSVVDRYLEHSRIYYFQNGGKPEFFLASADWMPRNLNRRIELLFPVYDKITQQLLFETMQLALHDKRKGRLLQPGGSYTRTASKTSDASRSQACVYTLLRKRLLQRQSPQQQGPLQVIQL